MIDSHAHLKSDKGADGLAMIILAGSDMADSKENIELAKKQKKYKASVGIHPQAVIKEKEAEELEELIRLNKKWIVAMGECGLDFSENKANKKWQEQRFKNQIELAIKYKLPLIIHARKAVDEVVEILGEYKKARGVFHCYAGGKKRIEKILNLGENWYFGLDGNLTYEIGMIEVARAIPADRLILETDSPYLTPVPHRGAKNKPEYVKFIYEKMAEIWQKSFFETEKIIDTSAKRLFKI